MPWDASSFAKKDHALSPAQAAKGARIATAIVERGGDEGMAIATGIKRAKAKKADALQKRGLISERQRKRAGI